MRVVNLLLQLSFFLLTIASPSPSDERRHHRACAVPYAIPNIRYPPPLLFPPIPPNPSWPAPSAQDIYGSFKITYSSRPSYHFLPNLQGDHYPILPNGADFPSGSEYDLVSWSNPTNTTSDSITTAFGFLKPLPAYGPATWNYSSTGPLVTTTNVFSILAFGVDTRGHGYRVDYETAYPGNPDCFNIASRVETGPSPKTVRDIIAGLKNLGDARLAALATNLTVLVVDGRRTGMPPVMCDEACTLNADLIPA